MQLRNNMLILEGGVIAPGNLLHPTRILHNRITGCKAISLYFTTRYYVCVKNILLVDVTESPHQTSTEESVPCRLRTMTRLMAHISRGDVTPSIICDSLRAFPKSTPPLLLS